jgi:hypothetical protein
MFCEMGTYVRILSDQQRESECALLAHFPSGPTVLGVIAQVEKKRNVKLARAEMTPRAVDLTQREPSWEWNRPGQW